MDRERQTLELLQLLGDEVAEEVLGRLQPERAEKLRASLKSDRPLLSTISRQREVLDEFECFFQFALKSKPPEPVPYANGPDSATSDKLANAEDTAKDSAADSESSSAAEQKAAAELKANELNAANSAATAAAGEDQSSEGTTPANTEENAAESAANQENTMAATPSVTTAQTTGDPLQDLQTLSIHQIALALASEQSRTTAILLTKLPARLTGDVLNLLKPDYQKLVMKELTKEQHAPAVLVERIARATFIRAQQLPSDPPDTRNHADRVAEVLRSVPKAGRRNMLAAIEEQDPELAKSLLTRIYRFDDIAGLNKTVVQRVLGEVDSTNLTTALFGAASDVKDAIFSNLSKRARQTIEEEMQFMTNLPESRIQQAREAIAEVIARIDMESEA